MIRFHQLQKGSCLTTFALRVLPTAGDAGGRGRQFSKKMKQLLQTFLGPSFDCGGGGGGKHYLDGELSIANEPLPVTNVAHK